MKNIILIIIIILLAGFGIWYLVKNSPKQNSQLNPQNFSTENTEGQVSTTSTETSVINNNPSSENLGGQANKKSMNAILHTSMGDITIKLSPETTPNTVENFTKLAKSGFYDGTKFHRVIKDFMNQGGDPLSKDDSQMARWGTGGPGYQFADEITGSNNNAVGSISMANAGPNTNGSQFFINVADNSFLNTKHTVFGNVVEGMDVVMAINNVKTAPGDRPIEPVIIKSITIK
jgi:peptidylprolyl isomerase